MKTEQQTATIPDHLHGNMRKAFKALSALGCPVFVRKGEESKQTFCISAETDTEEPWAVYYPEWQTYPYENPKIDEVLAKYGLTADWENPGSMAVFD